MNLTPMAEPYNRRLLVPMNIEALVVEKNDTTNWANLTPKFINVNRNEFLGQDLETPISDVVTGLNKPGVHLHWALPDGLAHGVQEGEGELKFPLIPNRWLIVRLWDDDAGEKPELQFRAWVVESDSITTDTTATRFPRGQPPENQSPLKTVLVGKRSELDNWREGSPDSVDLTALGYGDPAFAAYYPACKTVLGFHDKDLDQDLSNLNSAALKYFVAGWYSDPGKDPLYKTLDHSTAPFEDLARFLGSAKWIYPGFDLAMQKVKRAKDLGVEVQETTTLLERMKKNRPDATAEAGALETKIGVLKQEQVALGPELETLRKNLPAHIICHGVISGIGWKKEGAKYPGGVPPADAVQIAVGNTAIQALTVLFKAKLSGTDLPLLLEAFQYDLLSTLEKPGGRDALQQKIHERHFSPLSRGIRWDLIQGAPPADAGGEQSPPVPGDVFLLLEKLNTVQRNINHLKRELDSARSQLYAVWYKKVLFARTPKPRVKNPDATDKDLKEQESALQQRITALTTQIQGLEDENGRPRGDEWKALQKNLAVFLPGYEIEKVEETRFWKPNDPVVLLAGPTFQRSARHGEDGRYRSDGRLLCRLDGQEVTRIKITVTPDHQPEFGPSDLDKWCLPLLGKPLPAKVTDLLRECLLLALDKKRAHAIIYAAYEKIQPGLADNRKEEVSPLSADLLAWALQNFRDDSSPPGFVPKPGNVFAVSDQFTIPSPVCNDRWQKNPWLPLFLQWQVTWAPAYSKTADALKNWNLNPEGTAFSWPGEAPKMEGKTYSGANLLTATATLNFSERLREYTITHDNRELNQKLREFQTAVRSMNVLCQALGGLNQNLTMRKPRLELRPIDQKNKDLATILQQMREWLSPLTEDGFFPIRAGHLKLEKLRIVDAFGQFLELSGDVLKRIASEPSANRAGEIQFEPRLAQPARLLVEWLPASRIPQARAGNGVELQEEFNPVCGWVLPNFLDQALMIYDATGHALGSLQAVKTKSWVDGFGGEAVEIEGFHWIGLPGSKSFIFGPSTPNTDPLGPAANPDLRDFVLGLLSLDTGKAQAFAALLQKMNEALSVAGGVGSSQNPNLALLIGKPLALVRASIKLELDGLPATAQGWNESTDSRAKQADEIGNLKFAVRLGDRKPWKDLWLGEDGLVGFFQKHDYTRFFPAYGITGKDDAYNHYSAAPEISAAAPLDLTLLMDPARGICATTGILPKQIFDFPYRDIADTLENKQVIFYTGPVLSPKAAAEKPEIRMPQPSDVYGQWSWTHHTAVEVWREEGITDTQKEPGYFFEAPLEIEEGWLSLVTAPLAIRAFTIKGKNPARKGEKGNAGEPPPDEFDVRPGQAVILSWTVTGADAIEVLQDQSSLFKSQRHPLPSQYRIEVKQDCTFKLNASDRAGQVQVRTIAVKVVPENRGGR